MAKIWYSFMANGYKRKRTGSRFVTWFTWNRPVTSKDHCRAVPEAALATISVLICVVGCGTCVKVDGTVVCVLGNS